MPENIIDVEKLGKKYLLGQHKKESYASLREVFSNKVNKTAKKIIAYGNIKQPKNIFWALKNVSFSVKCGEVIGIIGKNGAGKSTLLKLLSRITIPTEGRIRIKGRVASLLEVGTGFHPELTGRENIYLNGAILGMTKLEIRNKFQKIVEFSEIEKFLDTPVKRYSSGMYVRLAFAVAANLEPEILVVDEVLAVGDSHFQKKCLGKMSNVSSEGRTVLLVSHNMTAISSLCQRVLLLEEGKLVYEGSTNKAISKYLNSRSIYHNPIVNLQNHEGRTKHREKAFISSWIENKDGIMGGIVRMGEQMSIHVKFKCSQPVVAPGLGFGVEDIEGRRIFSFNNHMMKNSEISHKIMNGIIKCYIPRIPLITGKYFITISLTESKSEYIDRIERALSFVVEPADIYGSGVIPKKTQGVIFTDATISCEPDLPHSLED